jgi:hypothetical protein
MFAVPDEGPSLVRIFAQCIWPVFILLIVCVIFSGALVLYITTLQNSVIYKIGIGLCSLAKMWSFYFHSTIPVLEWTVISLIRTQIDLSLLNLFLSIPGLLSSVRFLWKVGHHKVFQLLSVCTISGLWHDSTTTSLNSNCTEKVKG